MSMAGVAVLFCVRVGVSRWLMLLVVDTETIGVVALSGTDVGVVAIVGTEASLTVVKSHMFAI